MKSPFLKKAKEKVQEASGPEGYLVQAVRSLDDLDETNALLYQRLEEWFKIHEPTFPLAGEEAAYFIAHMDNEKALLEKWPEEKLRHMAEKSKTSFGAELVGPDKGAVQFLARQIDAGLKTRKDLEEYVRSLAQKLMPNACMLIDGLLAARLLSVIGTLDKLSLFPASTLQVLGAEKALFKHLRKGTLPPKHGLLFQSPYVNGVPFDKRGKAARALAGKLAIALKADRFTKAAIGLKLKADLEKRMGQILALPTRNIKPMDYRDFAQKRFNDRGPMRGPYRERFQPNRQPDRGFRPVRTERSSEFGPRKEGFRHSEPRKDFDPRERNVPNREPVNDNPHGQGRREFRQNFNPDRTEGPRLSFKERQRRFAGGSHPAERFATTRNSGFKSGGLRGKKPWQKRKD